MERLLQIYQKICAYSVECMLYKYYGVIAIDRYAGIKSN